MPPKVVRKKAKNKIQTMMMMMMMMVMMMILHNSFDHNESVCSD